MWVLAMFAKQPDPLFSPIRPTLPSNLWSRPFHPQLAKNFHADSSKQTPIQPHPPPPPQQHHCFVDEPLTPPTTANMHLMYLPESNGAVRRYTLKKVMDGQVTKSAHPARFSPDDKWSRHRIAVRKRFAVLLAQQSELFYPPLPLPPQPRRLLWRGRD